MDRALGSVLVAVAAAMVLAACGSDGSSAGGSSPDAAAPPAGASRALRGIYRAFPAPAKSSLDSRSAAVVEAGEAACAGRRPVAVKEEFYAEAESSLSRPQAQMIGRIEHFEAEEQTDQGFVAGQLAADVYAATLPAADAELGYRGCVYSLALRLKRELAPAGG